VIAAGKSRHVPNPAARQVARPGLDFLLPSIRRSQEKCKYYKQDAFPFGNSYPIENVFQSRDFGARKCSLICRPIDTLL